MIDHPGRVSTDPPPPLRVKFGKNPYHQNFDCAYCHHGFESGGFFLRLELRGVVIDMPVCEDCLETGNLFETVVAFRQHSPSHPVMLA